VLAGARLLAAAILSLVLILVLRQDNNMAVPFADFANVVFAQVSRRGLLLPVGDTTPDAPRARTTVLGAGGWTGSGQ
jgi:hypothetical protein